MYNKSAPKICIAHSGCFSSDKINEIQYGIEEEGLFSEIVSLTHGDIYAAASRLSGSVSTGVCIAVNEEHAVLAYEKCGPDFPVLAYNMDHPLADFFRVLGKNAARLVKGLPFI